MDNKIFSGENGKKLWDKFHGLHKYGYDKIDLLDFLYTLLCRIQELEDKLDQKEGV